MKNIWYIINDIDKLDTPSLVIHKDRVQYNIDLMISMVGNHSRLRPHVKTYKIPEVVSMQMASGINKFKCATIAEAEMLARTGAPDVLLAYQPSAVKTERLLKLKDKYGNTTFSTLMDNEETASMIAEKCRNTLTHLKIYVDLNNGNNRTGIAPEEAFPLFKKCLELKGIDPLGLHVYDGHIRDSDPEDRKRHCDRDFSKVTSLAEYIHSKLDVDAEIIAGGSPTFGIHAARNKVNCSPGTTLFWDAGYEENFPDLPFQNAAVVITRVISRPATGLLCLDLGHKSIAGENPIQDRVRFLNAQELQPVSHSEEHLVVANTAGLDLKVGDVIYGIPYHICPTTALYDRVPVVRNNQVIDTWNVTARNRQITI